MILRFYCLTLWNEWSFYLLMSVRPQMCLFGHFEFIKLFILILKGNIKQGYWLLIHSADPKSQPEWSPHSNMSSVKSRKAKQFSSKLVISTYWWDRVGLVEWIMVDICLKLHILKSIPCSRFPQPWYRWTFSVSCASYPTGKKYLPH